MHCMGPAEQSPHSLAQIGRGMGSQCVQLSLSLSGPLSLFLQCIKNVQVILRNHSAALLQGGSSRF